MLFLLACADPPPPAKVPVAAPASPEPALPVVTPDAPADGAGFHWQPLASGAQDIGGVAFGPWPKGKDGLDGETLHKVDDKVWLVSHFERAPASAWRSEVDLAGGALRSTVAMPDGEVGEGLNYCAAARTPWNTHLGGMEYEPDAAIVTAEGKLPAQADRGHGVEKVYDEGYNELKTTRPYSIGWMWEAAPDAGPLHPRRAMGRFSHELGRVLPDGRTVYLSDDQAHGGGLFLFVADKAEDLSAGTLYAAKLGPTVRWVSLGHATDAEVDAALAATGSFTDLFDRSLDATCTPPAVQVTAGGAKECLTLKPGKALAASRLETRRYAGLLGASTWVTKEEGIATDGATRLWLAMSVLSDADGGVANPCGAVMELGLASGQVDTNGAAIDSALVATSMRTLVEGHADGKLCTKDGISNPDNLAWLEGHDTLVIAEDTHRRADQASWLWSWRDGALTPVFAALGKGEFTGLDWNAELDAGTLAVQGPEGASGFVGLLRPVAQ